MAARVAAKSEINVTPFVDVMLVLLIIFMVAAPLATTSIKLGLRPPPDRPIAQTVPPVFVSLQDDGTIHVGSERLGESAGDWRSLAGLLREKSGGNLGVLVFVRADREVNYGDVVRLFDEVRAAGYTNVSVVTEDPAG